MKWSIFFVNIIIHIAVMSLFLTFFFFTIAQYFEKKIVENQIDFVIDDFVGNSLKPLKPENKQEIKHEINESFNSIDFTKADDDVKRGNKKIQNKAWTFVGILVIIIMIIVIIVGFIYKWEKYYIKFLIVSAVLSLLFVFIAETLFLYLIGNNYLSADPNGIKMNIIKTLGNNRCDPKKDKDCIGNNF